MTWFNKVGEAPFPQNMNHKNLLQEWVQKTHCGLVPRYETAQIGLDKSLNICTFKSKVFLPSPGDAWTELPGFGEGKSKKEAEACAAKLAYEYLTMPRSLGSTETKTDAVLWVDLDQCNNFLPILLNLACKVKEVRCFASEVLMDKFSGTALPENMTLKFVSSGMQNLTDEYISFDIFRQCLAGITSGLYVITKDKFATNVQHIVARELQRDLVVVKSTVQLKSIFGE